jgi:hypothetical protein
LPFNRLTGFNASGITGRPRRGPNQEAAIMADETDDPDTAAARLEAALERIARRAAVQPAARTLPAEPYVAELADRLDSLIDRVRGALATK